MRVFGLGPMEIVLIAAIMSLNVIPALGFYRISRKAGYDGNAGLLWAVGYVFAGWITLLILAFIDWPRDRQPLPQATSSQ